MSQINAGVVITVGPKRDGERLSQRDEFGSGKGGP